MGNIGVLYFERTTMAEPEDSVPWEVRLLQSYCDTEASLDALGYAKQSVLAGAWFVATQTTSQHADVCLCGEGRVGQCMVRQWVEFYIARIRSETPWDSITNDQLKTVLEELNSHLSSRIFLISYKLSLADILLYYGLHRYMAGLTFQQKAGYIHVSRWFDQVQHFPRVRPFSLPLVVFHKNPDMLTH